MCWKVLAKWVIAASLFRTSCDDPWVWVNSDPVSTTSIHNAFVFNPFYLQFLQNHPAPLFHTRCTITVFLNYPGLLLKDNMSSNLTSIRIIAHTSVMAGAPALFIQIFRLSQTVLRPLGRSSFPTVTQQKARTAVTAPQKFVARQVRQQYRIKQISAQSVYQQRPKQPTDTVGPVGHGFGLGLIRRPGLRSSLYPTRISVTGS